MRDAKTRLSLARIAQKRKESRLSFLSLRQSTLYSSSDDDDILKSHPTNPQMRPCSSPPSSGVQAALPPSLPRASHPYSPTSQARYSRDSRLPLRKATNPAP